MIPTLEKSPALAAEIAQRRADLDALMQRILRLRDCSMQDLPAVLAQEGEPQVLSQVLDVVKTDQRKYYIVKRLVEMARTMTPEQIQACPALARILAKKALAAIHLAAFELYYWRIFADDKNLIRRFALAIEHSAREVSPADAIAWYLRPERTAKRKHHSLNYDRRHVRPADTTSTTPLKNDKENDREEKQEPKDAAF